MRISPDQHARIAALLPEFGGDPGNAAFLHTLLTVHTYRRHLYSPSVACINAVNKILGLRELAPDGFG